MVCRSQEICWLKDLQIYAVTGKQGSFYTNSEQNNTNYIAVLTVVFLGGTGHGNKHTMLESVDLMESLLSIQRPSATPFLLLCL